MKNDSILCTFMGREQNADQKAKNCLWALEANSINEIIIDLNKFIAEAAIVTKRTERILLFIASRSRVLARLVSFFGEVRFHVSSLALLFLRAQARKKNERKTKGSFCLHYELSKEVEREKGTRGGGRQEPEWINNRNQICIIS
jgi:hypothetical protein